MMAIVADTKMQIAQSINFGQTMGLERREKHQKSEGL